MKKYKLCIFFSLGICFSVFSIDFFVIHYDTIRITDDKLYFTAFIDEDKNEEYDITWERINNIEYIIFNYTGNFMDYYYNAYYNKPLDKGLKRYLILYSYNKDELGDFILFYNDKNELVFAFYSKLVSESFFPDSVILTASSELVENDIVYSASNLLKINNLNPWSENSNGSGIGEKLFLENNPNTKERKDPKWRLDGVAFSNGFVDYNRPYLYEYNNRVKKVRINFNNKNDYMDCILEDTPQIQYFYFNRRGTEKIEIEILEIYKGSRSDDTCINKIFPYAYFYIFD